MHIVSSAFKAAVKGSVTYDISLIEGYNVGMEITGCEDFACTLPGGCVR